VHVAQADGYVGVFEAGAEHDRRLELGECFAGEAESFENLVRRHVGSFLYVGDRGDDCLDEPVQSRALGDQPLLVRSQRLDPVAYAVDGSGDLGQIHAQLAQQQDLLQAQQLLVLVVPVPVGPNTGRPKQPDLVVVTRRPRRHSG
jgi:hypothetical protein